MSTAGRRSAYALSAGIVILAAGLRFYRLDSQLWLDEIDALTESMQRPVAAILGQWRPGAASHVFYDLLGHACLRWLGEGALAARLPAALFGVAGVAALVFLARHVFGRRVALTSGLLLALSYHHVFHSQNARGYTALILFSILASHVLLRSRGRASLQPLESAGYAVTCALGAYSVLFGAFVPAGHAAVVAADHVLARLRARAAAVAGRPFVASVATGMLLGTLLYAPFAGQVLRFTVDQSQLATQAGGPEPSVGYRLGVLRDALHGLGRAFGGRAGLTVAGLVALVGVGLWARRDAFSLAVLAAPLGLQLVGLLAAGVPLSPRYFAMALPVLVLATGLGVSTLSAALAGCWPRPRTRRSIEAAVTGAVLLASALPLLAYYRVPKQDFRGAIARVGRLAREGDLKVAVHYAGHVIRGYYGADFQDVRTLAELEALESSGRHILLVTTLERFLAVQAPDLYRHIQASYGRVAVLPSTIDGAEMNVYEREGRP